MAQKDTQTGHTNMGSPISWGLTSQPYGELTEQYKEKPNKMMFWDPHTGKLEPAQFGASVAPYAEGDIISESKGTTARANGGKAKWSLLPMHLLEGVVRVLEFGAKKYAEWNWAKGGPWSTPFNSAQRHLLQFYWKGENNDPETGLHHLDHAITNLLFLRHYFDTYKDGDDRPVKHFGKAE